MKDKSEKDKEKTPCLNKQQLYINKKQYIIFKPSMKEQLFNKLKKYSQTNDLILVYHQITCLKRNNSPQIYFKWESLIQVILNIDTCVGDTFSGSRRYKDLKDYLNFTHIQTIKFKNLIHFNFADCNLSTIQPLSWLDLQNIETLSFQSNNILTLMPFHKTAFKRLEYVDLSYNPFTYHCLVHFQRSISTSKLIHLKIYKSNKQINFNYLQDLRCFVKIKTDKQKKTKDKFIRIVYNQQNISLKNTRWKILSTKQNLIKLAEAAY